MAKKLAELFVAVTTDLKPLGQGLGKAQSQLQSFASKTSDRIGQLRSTFSAFASGFSTGWNMVMAPIKKVLGLLAKVTLALGAVAAASVALAAVVAVRFSREAIGLYKVQEESEMRLAAALKATGGAAGFTAKELQAYASSLQEVTKFGDEQTLAAMARLTTFKSIQGDIFNRATEAAMDLAETGFGSLETNIIQLGKALEDPAIGLTALRRVGVTFTQQQQEQIKSLVEANRLYEAQEILLAAVEGQVGGVARAMALTDTGKIQQAENAIGDLKEEIGKQLIPSLLAWKQAQLEIFKVLTPAIKEGLEAIREWFAEFKQNSALVQKLQESLQRADIKSLWLTFRNEAMSTIDSVTGYFADAWDVALTAITQRMISMAIPFSSYLPRSTQSQLEASMVTRVGERQHARDMARHQRDLELSQARLNRLREQGMEMAQQFLPGLGGGSIADAVQQEITTALSMIPGMGTAAENPFEATANVVSKPASLLDMLLPTISLTRDARDMWANFKENFMNLGKAQPEAKFERFGFASLQAKAQEAIMGANLEKQTADNTKQTADATQLTADNTAQMITGLSNIGKAIADAWKPALATI